ncbi:ALK tyrosine kinase receptor scd-2 like [Heracleum sosnowskyi]|uniref:ALK tyrosine kinase receptor scd-2 like n=1 Tax=Heracleum sosnowskyi TaxID=360622 RepID=A0AAD8H3C5_9APIA|nr:ALK tyrosine kinase receptor scd-2 like [Heracleum sosnowskyi]
MMRKVIVSMIMLMIAITCNGEDSNPVYEPCSDTKVKKNDGFTFGLAFAPKETFFLNQTQLSPCDKRLALVRSAKVALFRPKVDEISLLSVNTSDFRLGTAGAHMVAFAGRQFAARSPPVFVADGTHTVNSFTLVLEFQTGTLQNLFWKKYGCSACSGESVCVNNTDCAIPLSKCKSNGGEIDCSLGIQLAFSGTDKNYNVLNSWYEVANLRQYSLFGLYSKIRDVFTSR